VKINPQSWYIYTAGKIPNNAMSPVARYVVNIHLQTIGRDSYQDEKPPVSCNCLTLLILIYKIPR
jgi:hypothetical protein